MCVRAICVLCCCVFQLESQANDQTQWGVWTHLIQDSDKGYGMK